MKKIKAKTLFEHKINTTKFKVQLDGLPKHLDGEASWYPKYIRIRSNLQERYALEVWIHEFTHAYFDHLTEKEVLKFGRHLSKLLWKLNYRECSIILQSKFARKGLK